MKITLRIALHLLATTIIFMPHMVMAAAVPLPIIPISTASVMNDGSFTGHAFDAYYGVVQVQISVQGGALVDVKALKFPNHSGESRSINRQALPILRQEVVAAQSARINMVSGATLTSRAYIASLREALKQAGK